MEAWAGLELERAANPLSVQLKERGGWTELLGGPAAALGRKHLLRLAEAEVQVNQKAAPDAKGEKGAQAWRGCFP